MPHAGRGDELPAERHLQLLGAFFAGGKKVLAARETVPPLCHGLRGAAQMHLAGIDVGRAEEDDQGELNEHRR